MIPTRKHNPEILLGAIESVLTRTNRLLGANDKMQVNFTDGIRANIPNIAWTDGSKVHINSSHRFIKTMIERGVMTHDDMKLLLGANYHELAHCLLSPIGSSFASIIAYEGAAEAMMILEDSRIETVMVSQYDPVKFYFATVLEKYLSSMADRDQGPVELIRLVMTWGRKYLPKDLREQALVEAHQSGQYDSADLDRVTVLFDEYNTTLFPKNQVLMKKHSLELQVILDKYNSKDSGERCSGTGEGTGATQCGTQCGLSTISNDPRDEANNETNNSTGEGTGGSIPGGITKVQIENAQRENAQGENGEGFGVPDVNMEPMKDDGKPSGAGIGIGGGSEKTFDAGFKKHIEESEKGMMEDLVEKIKSVQKAKEKYTARGHHSSAKPKHQNRAPSEEEINASNKVYREFTRLKTKLAPGWHQRMKTGRVDTNHIARIKRGNTDVFKRWNVGINNALDFEVVMLLDTSGSMHGSMDEACAAMWCLHRALVRHKADVTVIGFGTYESVLFQRFEKPKKDIHIFGSSGGTQVLGAMKQADNIFQSSRRRAKIMVVVSDGGYGDFHEAEKFHNSLSIPTMMVGIGYNTSRMLDWKNVRATKSVQRPLELVDLTKNFVSNVAREIANAR